jgi:3-oxoacyl-[acyl-carrier-protein] synthase III
VSSDSIVLHTRLAVLGTGSVLPGAAISTAALLVKAGRYLPEGAPALALRIAKRLNIAQRHMVRSFDAALEVARPYDAGPKLASRAIALAVEQAQLNISQIRILLGHTTTPHTLLPANVAWVAEELGFNGAHLELRQACTGFAGALIISAGLAASGVTPIAIVGSETGSVFFDPRFVALDKTQLINLVQMGDGAGAIAVGVNGQFGGPRIELAFYGSLRGHRPPGISLRQGGSGQPSGQETRTAHFVHDFHAVKTHGLDLLREGLRIAREAGVQAGGIQWWIVHPANGRMAEIAADALNVPSSRVVCEASTLGNLGSAAVWVALDRLRRSGKLAAGDRVMVLGAEASKYMFGGFLYVHGDRLQ